jgi:hypothetical protein
VLIMLSTVSVPNRRLYDGKLLIAVLLVILSGPQGKLRKRRARSQNYPQDGQKDARFQWFWAGTQEDTKKLTADLKHTVKRHVVVRRVVPINEFPVQRVRAMRAKEQMESLAKRWSDSNTSYGSLRTVTAMLAAKRATEEAHEAKTADLKQRHDRPSLEDLFDFEFYVSVRPPHKPTGFADSCCRSE